MNTISRGDLQELLTAEKPDNDDRVRGYALVNVLPQELFFSEHIPGSINIPEDRAEEFERRFDKSKEIIVYCGSEDSPASFHVAEELEERGFSQVIEYRGGMNDWKGAGNEIQAGRDTIQEMRIA